MSASANSRKSRPEAFSQSATYPGSNQRQIFNVKAEPKNQTIDQRFESKYQQAGIGPTQKQTNAKPSPVQQVQTKANPRPTRRTVRPKKLPKKNPIAKKMAARMRVSGVNSVVFGVGTTLWVTVQLPLALLSTVLFGMALAVYGAIETATTPDGDDGLIVRGLKTVFGGATSLVRALNESIKNTFNLDLLSFVDPLTFFMVTYVILFAISLVLIFSMYTAYKLMRLNPIGGKGSGLKHGTLLLTMIGYALPFANMLPWFMVWAGAVWLKPK
jgi:hypothetical protein